MIKIKIKQKKINEMSYFDLDTIEKIKDEKLKNKALSINFPNFIKELGVIDFQLESYPQEVESTIDANDGLFAVPFPPRIDNPSKYLIFKKDLGQAVLQDIVDKKPNFPQKAILPKNWIVRIYHKDVLHKRLEKPNDEKDPNNTIPDSILESCFVKEAKTSRYPENVGGLERPIARLQETCPYCGENHGMSRGPVDANDDGELSGCELKYHFDLDGDGIVTPEEYVDHVRWHMENPSSIDNMEKDYLAVGKAQNIKTGKITIHINESLNIDENVLYEKKDRCYYQAKRKYKVFPSAYASGYIVRCRKGKVGKRKKRKNESIEIFIEDTIKELLEEGTFDKEKSRGLKGWFDRQGGKGKSKGWVDCNTCRTNPKTGRKTCKSCGRQKGEKRKKYPACRPTPSACTKSGTKRKKGSKRVSWKPKKKEE